MTRSLALDIEAVPQTDPPAFDQPSEWRTFAVACSLRPSPTADPHTAVHIRRDGSAHALRRLLCAVANWIEDRQPVDVIMGYNSESFDFPVLGHHIGQIADSQPDLAAHIKTMLDIPHRDLFAEIRERQPDEQKWPSLSESLTTYDIPVEVATLGDRIVDGGLMPRFGRRVLARDDGLSTDERRTLKRYCRTDVVPLHQLADSLDAERQQRIETEAAATEVRDV